MAPSPSCPTLLEGKASYYIETSCPADQELTEIGEKCKTSSLMLHTTLPVSDVQTQISYVNKYCALCNNVTRFKAWWLRLECTEGDPRVVAASSFEELLSLTGRGEKCTMNVLPPPGVPARMCTPPPEPLLSSCNVTGRWRVFDLALVRACAAFRSFYNESRNVFCQMCNEDQIFSHYEYTGLPLNPWSSSLVAVLNLQEDQPAAAAASDQGTLEQEQTESCQADHFLDPVSNRCRPMICTSGKVLRNGSCVSVLSASSLIGYSVNFFIISTTETAKLENFNLYLGEVANILMISTPMHKWVDLALLDLSTICLNETAIVEIHVTAKLVPDDFVLLNDDNEATLLEFFKNNKLGNNLLLHTESSHRTDGDSNTTDCPDYDVDKGLLALRSPSFDTKVFASGHLIKPLSPLLLCPQVALKADEYVYFKENNSVLIGANTSIISYPSFSLDGDLVTVCVDDYLASLPGRSADIAAENVANVSTSLMSTVQGILSLSCSVVSLSFLALTILAYIVFKELRTLAGVCCVCMVSVLFLAQAVFEFGAEQTEIHGVCVALGALAHYLWLSATFWMNACTLLMFYRLLFPLRAMVELHSRSKILVTSCVYSFGSPALIVGAVMGTSVCLQGDLGYGGSICYIKRAAIRRFALAVPVGCLVLVNLCLFLVTVIRLRRGSTVSASVQNKVGLVACTKLSIMTGLSWLSMFIYEGLRYEAMEYVAIVLFGLHGVVVFWAFAFSHYANLFRIYWQKQNSTSTGNATSDPSPSNEQ